MDNIEEEIRTLSRQLKKNGVVKTDADALTLARNILQTEKKNKRIIDKIKREEDKIEENINKVNSEGRELNKEVDSFNKVSNREEEAIKDEEQSIKNEDNFDPSKLEDPSYDITKEDKPLKELIEEANRIKKDNNVKEQEHEDKKEV